MNNTLMNTILLHPLFERNQEATVYVGKLDSKVNEELLWELFIQCGPVMNVHIPRDKITNEHQNYGFVEFKNEEDADYAIKIMHMIRLFGKPIHVNKASQDKRTQEVGANLFVGNLTPEVDEKSLKDVFSSFGIVLSTRIMRDPETGISKGYGFVNYDNFESADMAINTMNGQYISGQPVDVSYAYKRDTKGERHGSTAERIIASKKANATSGIPSGNSEDRKRPPMPPSGPPPMPSRGAPPMPPSGAPPPMPPTGAPPMPPSGMPPMPPSSAPPAPSGPPPMGMYHPMPPPGAPGRGPSGDRRAAPPPPPGAPPSYY
ncbi:unnamed protein product [Moneuplotes crassus]|uniref:RRM domain-containing protein n=1 Tax=Euplotes crassus TaxID=5936 RepID=A0AAD1XNM2_EUPCR|nr:unnamed protein product [Moneuplotes crassus]